ncbi:MAG: SurA N-terminal domain-containing protein [Alphaproteobacteria bacterium]
MNAFRKLAKNIFFKVILAIVGLSFVTFGISSFLIDMPNSWVLKVGSEKISLKTFEKALDMDRSIIRSNKGSSEEIENYLNSDRFKSEVANRLIRKTMIKKIGADIGAFGSKKLILKNVAEDKNFQDKDGKFDKEKFTNFLQNNGLNEEIYINEVLGEISGEMIFNTLSSVLPVNYKNFNEREEFNKEKRVVDLITISKNDVKNFEAPTEQDVANSYNNNKKQFVTNEYREIKLLEMDKKILNQKPEVSQQEMQAYYDQNLKTLFTSLESRDYYHLMVDDEKMAQEFQQKIISFNNSPNVKIEFAKMAKKLHNKSLKEITIEKISKSTLPLEIADKINNLQINQISEVVKSKIGFHIFLLNNINPERQATFAEVQPEILKKISMQKQEKAIEEQVVKLNEALLASKSLDEVATKFNLTVKKVNLSFDQNGVSQKNQEIGEVKIYKDLAKNTFALKLNQPSKLLQNSEDKFYAIEVIKIDPSRDLELVEVKDKIMQDLIEQRKIAGLGKLVKDTFVEIEKSPQQAVNIGYSKGLKIEKNKEFQRLNFVDIGETKMPIKNEIIDEIFEAKVGFVTKAVALSQDLYVIALVKDSKLARLTPQEEIDAKSKAVNEFAQDIVLEYNDYLSKKFPIEVNEKFFQNKKS